MQITSTLTFAAPPETVAAMFVSPSFAKHLADEIQARNVTVSSIDQGLTAVYTVATPDVAKRIIGEDMTLTQTTTWEPTAEPTGPRIGRLTMTIAGMPATADGPLRLTPTAAGSEVVYEADFVIKIPLVGRKLEQLAGNHLSGVLSSLQQVGDAWLAQPETTE